MNIRDWLLRNVLRIKQSPVAIAAITRTAETWGEGPEWAPENYGNYYAKSPLVYSAIKLRAESICRPQLRFYRQLADGDQEELEASHSLPQVMAHINDWWTRGDLWRATSIYLDLWGACYWVLTKDTPSALPREIWPVRPDRMRILADKKLYIRGFEYDRQGQRIPLAPDEVVWFRNFNPTEEFAGLSPIAPVRLSVDMGYDALKSNRNLFKRGILMNNILFQAQDVMTDEDIADFEKRLQKRFSGPDNAHRPMVAAGIEPKNLGLNPKDMEHINTLRWSLEDVCRVYGIPKPLLSDLERATYSNIDAAERIFWRNTIVPQLRFLEEEINERFVKQFGPDLEAHFDLSDIEALQPDVNQVWERLRANTTSGLMTINEARNQMALEPVPWGDSWWASLTLVPIQDESSAGLGTTEPLNMGYRGNGHHRRWQPPMLSDKNLERFGQVHSKRLTRFESRFRQMQLVLFLAQQRDVLKRLLEHKSVEKQGFDELFNAREWIERFIRSGKPLFVASIVESAESQIEQFGLGISFDVTNPVVQDWIAQRTVFWANRVNQETSDLLMREIAEAQELGESIRQIQERVEKVFRFNDAVRSERIARTESQASLNRGALEAYRQSGVVNKKMWIAVVDDRTRDTHLEAHRQVVELGAKFSVGGEMIDGPGEGSPENVINCRCTTGPVIEVGKQAICQPK